MRLEIKLYFQYNKFMISKFKDLIFRKRIIFAWILSFLVNSITLLLVSSQGNSSRSVVLHYNIIVGAEVFGRVSDLYKLPLIGFFILALNSVLYSFLKGRQDFLAEVSVFSALVVSMFLLIALFFLNGIN